MTEEKRGRGRPSEYRPEYCERVIELGRLGMSVVEMASEIGVSRNTLETLWTAAHPEFMEAMAIAREASQAWWESMGRTNLVMPKDAGTFQASVWSRSMGARFPRDWRENKGVALSGEDGQPASLQVTFVQPKPAVD